MEEKSELISLTERGLAIQRNWERLIGLPGLRGKQAFPRYRDVAERFELWASNIGLYRTGHASLDYRFQDAPKFEKFTHEVLQQLEADTSKLIRYLTEPESQKRDDMENESASSSDDSEPEELDADTVDDLMLGTLLEYIDKLYRLASKIQDPRTRIGSTKARTFQRFDPDSHVDLMQAYGDFDRAYIEEYIRDQQLSQCMENGLDRSSILHVDDWSHEIKTLVQRLASANSLRRKQFGYWKKRYHKMRAKPAMVQADFEQQAYMPSANQEATAAVLFMEPIARPQLAMDEPEPSATTVTRVNQAMNPEPTETHSTASSSVFSARVDNRLQVIELPERVQTQTHFECPYCFNLCSRKYSKGRAWRRHVIHDLRPYICTSSSCSQSDQMFDNLAEWAAHESSHLNLPSGNQGKYDDVEPQLTCNICARLGANLQHVAQHLEHIACFALPRSTGYEEEDVSKASGAAQARTSDDEHSTKASSLLEEREDVAGANDRSDDMRASGPSEPESPSQAPDDEARVGADSSLGDRVQSTRTPPPQRIFACDKMGCERSESRWTSEDLEKHNFAAHDFFGPQTELSVFLCSSHSCQEKQGPEIWDEESDFMAHCQSHHHHEDLDQLVFLSRRSLVSLGPNQQERLRLLWQHYATPPTHDRRSREGEPSLTATEAQKLRVEEEAAKIKQYVERPSLTATEAQKLRVQEEAAKIKKYVETDPSWKDRNPNYRRKDHTESIAHMWAEDT